MLTSMRGHKRVYRIYYALKLNLQIKPRKRLQLDKPDALAGQDASTVTSLSRTKMCAALQRVHEFHGRPNGPLSCM